MQDWGPKWGFCGNKGRKADSSSLPLAPLLHCSGGPPDLLGLLCGKQSVGFSGGRQREERGEFFKKRDDCHAFWNKQILCPGIGTKPLLPSLVAYIQQVHTIFPTVKTLPFAPQAWLIRPVLPQMWTEMWGSDVGDDCTSGSGVIGSCQTTSWYIVV